MALKQLVFKKKKILFFWRNCSRQIARHLAIQNVIKKKILKKTFFLFE